MRIQIANRLLDDGADGAAQRRDGINGLHVLFGARSHDFEPEAALVRRLLSCGADVNAVGGKRGRPLYVLIGNFAISDGEYAPFYDILFSLDDLDLTSPQGRLRPIVELVDKYEKYRPDVVRRVHEYVRTQEGA